jgi:preprotein translocase subunit SecD
VEGSYWLRISAVLGLVLGSVYVLLPTFVQDSAEDRFANAASGVDVPGAKRTSLDVTLPVGQGDPVALAAVVDARLKAAAVPVAKVESDATDVSIKLAAGGDKAAVARLASRAGATTLFAPTAFVQVPAPGAEVPAAGPLAELLALVPATEVAFWADALPKVDALQAPAGVTPIPTTLGSFSIDGDTVKTTVLPGPASTPGAPFGDGVPFAIVAVDGFAQGAVAPDGRYWSLQEDRETVAVLLSGPLPGALLPPVPEAAVDPAVQQDRPKSAVSALAAYLPDSKIVFGLDLVGGIDLTLQVDLEEAVLGQVSRDLVYLKEQAEKEGIVLENARRDYSTPMLELTTAAKLADLQSFFAKRANDYEYVDTAGTTHRFQLKETRQEEVRGQAVEQVLETLRKRVNATGVKEPSIAKKGGGRIEVQLPGLEDVQSAVDAIGTTAVLEFHMVDEEFEDAAVERVLADARVAMPPDQYADDRLLNQWAWQNKKLPEDRQLLWLYQQNKETGLDERLAPIPVLAEVALTGNDVNNAGVGWDTNNDPYVTLEFKPRGGQIFCELTGKAVGKRFAIVLDGHIQSAPGIREQICGGAARIEMKSSAEPLKDSQTLALVLRTGALDAPVVVASVRQVGASLGQDAIYQGTVAALVGSLFVCVFMVLWYQTSGVIANLSLLVNVLMLMASLAMFGATLTLPGIAGIALTVGMAVDSNIIVYERIREELRLGVQARKAVDVGFEKALVAIVDANITTAIAGIVMYSYGTGPLKGFAVTLLVGIATTLVSAVFVTRTIMEVMTRSSNSRLRI